MSNDESSFSKRERSSSVGRRRTVYKTSKRLPENLQRTKSTENLLTLNQSAILPSTIATQSKPLKPILKQTSHLNAVIAEEMNLHTQTVPKEVLQNCQLSHVTDKCRVTSVFSPTEFYVRFSCDEADFKAFQVELQNTLVLLKKHPKRISPFRKNLTPGTLCLMEYEQKLTVKNIFGFNEIKTNVIVQRVYVGAINNDDECLVELTDMGGFVSVELDKLWPLLPVAFYESVIKRPRFAQKCSLRWPDVPMSDRFFETQIIMKEFFRDKTFLYSAHQEGETIILLLRLPDVEEDMSQILQQLLLNYEMNFRETLQILKNIEWVEKCGSHLKTDDIPKGIIPKIAEFIFDTRSNVCARLSLA